MSIIESLDAPSDSLFEQAAEEVEHSLEELLSDRKDLRDARVLERLLEPDRIVRFRIEWIDDEGRVQLNRGWRVQQTNLLGPYKGGLRFHPSVTEDTLRFLAFEQAFKNALTGLPLGAGKGGSDFDPKGKSDEEVMRFCQAFMRQLIAYIGPDRDVPAGDIGVGGREIGYLYGAYLRHRGEHGGVVTGKPIAIGGIEMRSEATGYGVVAFAREMLDHAGGSFEDARVVISGAGNVALHAAERAIELGARVLTLSDSGGTIVCEGGLDAEQLGEIRTLKEEERGRLKSYESKGVEYRADATPWDVTCEGGCDVALPCATQNELDAEAAETLVSHGVKAVAEGANMPCTPEAVSVFRDAGVLFGPGKAANAGGVGTSGFEMGQNAQRIPWTREQASERLDQMMRDIHSQCVERGKGNDGKVDYVRGANIAGFLRLAEAMLAMGVG